jgi:hypothetical protein
LLNINNEGTASNPIAFGNEFIDFAWSILQKIDSANKRNKAIGGTKLY